MSEINSLDKINKELDAEGKKSVYWNVPEDSNRNYINWSTRGGKKPLNEQGKGKLWDNIKWPRREGKWGSRAGRKNIWSS